MCTEDWRAQRNNSLEKQKGSTKGPFCILLGAPGEITQACGLRPPGPRRWRNAFQAGFAGLSNRLLLRRELESQQCRIKQKGPVNEASFTGPFCLIGAPGEIRTPDRSVRSRVLYPAELRARAWYGKAAHYAKLTRALSRTTHGIWRRERDSNPRWRFKPPYSLSRGAPSTSSAISPCMRLQAYRGGRMA